MRKVDLKNKRFGKLLVIEECEAYISPKGYKKSQWLCKCNCGNYTKVMSSHLTTGHTTSCGCDKLKHLKPRKIKNIVGKKFHNLTVIKQLENRQIGKDSRVNWLCQCDCGNYTEVLGLLLTSGLIKSCGCVSRPYSEQFMEEYLNKYNIDYICQYFFDDLIGLGNLPLKFDFAIFKNNKLFCLIELNGLQHYKPVKYFGGNEEFKKRVHYDNLKINYCKANNIKLIIIDVSKCSGRESFYKEYDKYLKFIFT